MSVHVGKKLFHIEREIQGLREKALETGDPKDIAKYQHSGNQAIRAEAKDGQHVEVITGSHADAILAAIGREFETIANSKFVRQFSRHKPRLYLTKSTSDFGANYKDIFISEAATQYFSHDEICAALSHEFGHHLANHKNFRNGAVVLEDHTNPEAEYLADEIGGFLSRRPQALKQLLEKLRAPLVAEVGEFTVSHRELLHGYPIFKHRLAKIDETAQRMTTDEGCSQVEAELIHKLEAEHRKLFPNHYSRPGGVTRGHTESAPHR